MKLAEPSILVSDYLLGIVNLSLGFALLREGVRIAQASVRLWGWGFFALAAAAFCGGTYHGFHEMMGPLAASRLWLAVLYAIGLGGFFVVAGSMAATITPQVRHRLLILPGLQLVFYLMWITEHPDFQIAILNYIPSLAICALLFFFRLRSPGSLPILGGILVSVLAAGIEQSGIELHRYFNRHDLYHLVQAAGMFLYYRGARNLRDNG